MPNRVRKENKLHFIATITNFVVAQLFSLGFFSLNQRTPLHNATRRTHEDIVRYLVDKGANINAKEKNGVILLI